MLIHLDADTLLLQLQNVAKTERLYKNKEKYTIAKWKMNEM